MVGGFVVADALCVIRDHVDPVKDEQLADFVVSSHMASHPNFDAVASAHLLEEEVDPDVCGTFLHSLQLPLLADFLSQRCNVWVKFVRTDDPPTTAPQVHHVCEGALQAQTAQH